MKLKLIFLLVAIFGVPIFFLDKLFLKIKSLGSIPIKNPYSDGQTFDSNITVSGIGRGRD
jgi:hypothetical protein